MYNTVIMSLSYTLQQRRSSSVFCAGYYVPAIEKSLPVNAKIVQSHTCPLADLLGGVHNVGKLSSFLHLSY